MKISILVLISLIFNLKATFADENDLEDQSAKAQLCSEMLIKSKIQNTPMILGMLKAYEEQSSLGLTSVKGTSCTKNPIRILSKVVNFGYDDMPGYQVTYHCPGIFEDEKLYGGHYLTFSGHCSMSSDAGSPLGVVEFSSDPDV